MELATPNTFVSERALRNLREGGDRVPSFGATGSFGGVFAPFLNIEGGRNVCMLIRERRLGAVEDDPAWLVDWLADLWWRIWRLASSAAENAGGDSSRWLDKRSVRIVQR